MEVEVGIQIDELPCTCKYGCDLIEGNDHRHSNRSTRPATAEPIIW